MPFDSSILECADAVSVVASFLTLRDTLRFASVCNLARSVLVQGVRRRYASVWSRTSDYRILVALRCFFTPTLLDNTGGLEGALVVMLRNKVLSLADILALESLAALPPFDERADALSIVVLRAYGEDVTLGHLVRDHLYNEQSVRSFCVGHAHHLHIYLRGDPVQICTRNEALILRGGEGCTEGLILPICREGGFFPWRFARTMGAAGVFEQTTRLIQGISSLSSPLSNAWYTPL